MITDYGIKRVVYGIDDPNLLVAGKGISALRAKGIKCDRIELDAVGEFYRAYCFWQQYQRPWVSAKLALSLDAKIAFSLCKYPACSLIAVVYVSNSV